MLKPIASRTLRLALLVFVAGALINLGGCSLFKKKPVETTPVLTGPTAPEIPGPTVGDTFGESAAEARPFDSLNSLPTTEFEASAGVRDIRFDYDQADIRADQMSILDGNIKYFRSNPNVKIMVEGHTDERGSNEYNFALGQRRAEAVQDYLIQNGIDASRLATVSKGEAQPADPAQGEAAWAKNRRAHFMRIVTE